MTSSTERYRPRLVDRRLEDVLHICGAVNLKGPRWCGKTWSARNLCNSAVCLDGPGGDDRNRSLALMDPSLVLEGDSPQLIDEWQEVPSIWDAVRQRVDDDVRKGLFILAGSSVPDRGDFIHSGVGRMMDIRMDTMTLSERGLSDGKVSLRGLFDLPDISVRTGGPDYRDLVDMTVHGGWPAALSLDADGSMELAGKYLEELVSDHIHLDGTVRNGVKMRRLMHSLALSESRVVSKKALYRIASEGGTMAYNTFDGYLDVLVRSYIVEWQPAFDPGMRPYVRVGKMPKLHLSDPSLAAVALGTDLRSYYRDPVSFGPLFESLCEHDLRIYADTFGGRLYHYRDGDGKEIDAIVELPDGRWGAFEIKLGANEIEKGAKSLLDIDRKIRNQENGRPPEFLCVVCGLTDYAYRRPDGVYVVPITSLRE